MILPDAKELTALLQLLDDETPEVRAGVEERLANFSGDLSEILPLVPLSLGESERSKLSDILSPARRRTLREEWLTPSFGKAALGDDWDLFESQLRLLSDFLHDGVSIRQPLSDALDLLSEEAEEAACSSADDLRVWLFEGSKLRANKKNYYDPRNSDLAWCLAEGVSNPIGLCVVFMLLGKRLNFEIEGISFPGHFLCRIFEDSEPLIVDCFDRGKLHVQKILISESGDLSREQVLILKQSTDLGTILIRILNNMIDSFQRTKRHADAGLITVMRDSMMGKDSEGGPF